MGLKHRLAFAAVALLSAWTAWATVTTKVSAASGAGTNDYEVQPVLPESQVNMAENFYDLKLAPGQTQTIQLRIQNFTSKTIKVKSGLGNAVTQTGGGIVFEGAAAKPDVSLKHPFTTLATQPHGQATVTLGPRRAKTLSVTITMPQKAYAGMIYGDWHFSEAIGNKAKARNAVGAKYAYSVGVLLRGTDFRQTFPKLRYKNTEPFLANRHPAMGINIQNTAAMAMRQVSILAKVSLVGSHDITRVYSKTGVMIAPSSTLKIPISWNYNTMKPGTYKVSVVIKGQNYGNRFPMTLKFNRQFRVAAKKAAAINEKAVKKPKNKWVPVAYATGALWLVALGSLIWMLAVRPRT